jgi:hypothetical protein
MRRDDVDRRGFLKTAAAGTLSAELLERTRSHAGTEVENYKTRT